MSFFRLFTALAILLSIIPVENSFAEDKLFFSNHSGLVFSSDLDGSNVETLFDPNSDPISNPADLDVDSTNDKLYFVDNALGKIFRADLDGSNLTEIATVGGALRGIAVDPRNEKIYFTENGTGTKRVRRINYDGSSLEDILTGLRGPEGIALDISNSTLYVGDDDRILSSSFDGTILNTIVDLSVLDPEGSVRGVAIHFSEGKIYWADHTRFEINRADLDGTNQESIFSGQVSPEFPEFIVLDLPNSKIAWGSTSTLEPGVLRSDIFGDTTKPLIVNDLLGVIGIAINSCGAGAPDSDSDGTPDCLDECPNGGDSSDSDGDGALDCIDVCPNDSTKTEDETVCGCNAFLDPQTQQCGSAPASDDESEPLTPDTTLEESPDLVIRNRRATVLLEQFDGATLARTGASSQIEELIQLATRSGISVRYRVIVRRTDRGKRRSVRKRTTKRSQATFKRLAPGNYSAKYRAMIVNRKNKVRSRTNFSPARTFTITRR